MQNSGQGNVLICWSDLTNAINKGGLFRQLFHFRLERRHERLYHHGLPEPSTCLAAVGLLGLMLWPARRFLLIDAKSILGLRSPSRDRLRGPVGA